MTPKRPRKPRVPREHPSQPRLVAVPDPKPYDAYADSARRNREALFRVRSDIAVKQARAFLSYGDIGLQSAVTTIVDFQPAFERRYGALT